MSELDEMSAPVLRDLVGQLQEDLMVAIQQNAKLQGQTDKTTDSIGITGSQDSMENLKTQVSLLY